MYSHLSRERRLELAVLKREGFSLRQIAGRLGVSPSTVCRELRRNKTTRTDINTPYHATEANYRAKTRRAAANGLRKKITPGSPFEQLLVDKIAVHKWSPEQVCGWLGRDGRRQTVCPRTVYDWIYKERRDLLVHLHCQKGKYRRTRANRLRKEARAKTAQVRHISRRGKAADSRRVFGHWEGDTVVGRGRSGYIATFVERKSGYLAAATLPKSEFGAAGFARAAGQAMEDIPTRQRRSLALDNGPEMQLPEELEHALGLQVYYATPYHSWERGCNENANGLLRYFFPKKMSLAGLTQADLDQAVCLLNNRPRKRLGWRTPAEVFKR